MIALYSTRFTRTSSRGPVTAATGKSPTLIPRLSRPGASGALALGGVYESYLLIAGPTWRNEIGAAVGLAGMLIRTTPSAKKLRCPLLVKIADFHRLVPAYSAAKTAAHSRAEVQHYPCDHFDVWPGQR
jgi:hypothetical protein